jgi:hypothetical protein
MIPSLRRLLAVLPGCARKHVKTCQNVPFRLAYQVTRTVVDYSYGSDAPGTQVAPYVPKRLWADPFWHAPEMVTRGAISACGSQSSNRVVENWPIAIDLTEVSARSRGQGSIGVELARNRGGKAKTRAAGRRISRPCASTRLAGCSIQNQKAPRDEPSSNSFQENLSVAYSQSLEWWRFMAIMRLGKYLIRVPLGRPSGTRKMGSRAKFSRAKE